LANRNVLGIQAWYTRFSEDGRFLDEISLSAHGMTEDSEIVYCQTIDLLNGEYIAYSGLAYSTDDLVLYFYSTNEGNTSTYGKSNS